MDDIIKAHKLEFNYLASRKANIALILLLPVITISVLGISMPTDFSVGYIEDTDKGLTEDNVKFTEDGYLRILSYMFSLLILFSAIQMGSLRVVAERAPYGTLDREILGISRYSMLIGKFTANFIFAGVQGILISITGLLWFNFNNPAEVLSVLIALSFFGVAYGLLISVFANTKDQAQQLVIISIGLFLILTGFSYPIVEDLKPLSENLPMSISISEIEKIIVSAEYALENIIKIMIAGTLCLSAAAVKFSSEQN